MSVSNKRLYELVREEKILIVNELYGIHYATPREPIEQAFEAEKFPLLDWPIDRLDVMERHFSTRLFRIYVEVDHATLRLRLEQDERDPTQSRLQAGLAELERFRLGEYDHFIDYRISNPTGEETDAVAQTIYEQYSSGNRLSIQACRAPELSGPFFFVEMVYCEQWRSQFLRVINTKEHEADTLRLLDISCAKCDTHLFYYQKDGPGMLKRMYLDRIYGSKKIFQPAKFGV